MKINPKIMVLSAALMWYAPNSLSAEQSDLNPDYVPQTASLQEILDNEIEGFRTEGIELFVWEDVPSLYVLDFKDCPTLGKSFVRMDYYYKDNSRILSNEQLEEELRKIDIEIGKFGWGFYNDSEELASFFNSALQNKSELFTEEKVLLNIVLQNGIITSEDGIYKATPQGILAITHECDEKVITYNSRARILKHETSHGLYGVIAEYREKIDKFWNEDINEDQRKYFKMVLAAMKIYDITDDVLVRSEVHANILDGSKRFEYPIQWLYGKTVVNWAAIRNYVEANWRTIKSIREKLESKVEEYLKKKSIDTSMTYAKYPDFRSNPDKREELIKQYESFNRRI